jgi:hypothetical protein
MRWTGRPSRPSCATGSPVRPPPDPGVRGAILRRGAGRWRADPRGVPRDIAPHQPFTDIRAIAPRGRPRPPGRGPVRRGGLRDGRPAQLDRRLVQDLLHAPGLALPGRGPRGDGHRPIGPLDARAVPRCGRCGRDSTPSRGGEGRGEGRPAGAGDGIAHRHARRGPGRAVAGPRAWAWPAMANRSDGRRSRVWRPSTSPTCGWTGTVRPDFPTTLRRAAAASAAVGVPLGGRPVPVRPCPGGAGVLADSTQGRSGRRSGTG